MRTQARAEGRCEDTGRRRPSASPGEGPREGPACPHLDPGLPAFRVWGVHLLLAARGLRLIYLVTFQYLFIEVVFSTTQSGGHKRSSMEVPQTSSWPYEHMLCGYGVSVPRFLSALLVHRTCRQQLVPELQGDSAWVTHSSCVVLTSGWPWWQRPR